MSSSTGSEPITRDYLGVKQTWERSDSETLLLYTVRERDGAVEICGAIGTDGINILRDLEPRILGRSSLSLNGTLIANDLRFFKRLNTLDTTAPKANCAQMGVPWKPEFETAVPKLSMRGGTFEV